MNDFDRFLERGLRNMLDPVVAIQPPPRRGRRTRQAVVLTVVPPAAELAAEPVAVTIAAANPLA